jgi:uncharacterized membrane protein YgcG
MKQSFLFSTIFYILFSVQGHTEGFASNSKSIADSDIINHVLDGSVSEWPENKFEIDKGTNIKYAIDNNAQDLYAALTIPDFRTQMKMMRMGMNLFIDLKGKKKENRGIEFPVKREDGDYTGGYSGERSDESRSNRDENDQTNGQRRKPDLKAIRNSMALNLIFMKLFGFTNGDPVKQGLQMPGTAQISYAWDSADVMHIEYLIPLKMLNENVESLKQKNISIGWKINGVEMPATSSSSFGTSSMGNSGGGGRSGRGGSGGFSRGSGSSTGNSNNFSQADREKMMEPQSFWTKFTLSIPSESKAF